MSRLNHLYSTQGEKRKTRENGKFQNKSNLLVIGYLISFLAFVVILQVFRWQVIFADKFASMAQGQYQTNRIQIAPRGVITAADGTVLAVDEPVWNIYATLSNDEAERKLFFENKDLFVSEVSSILGVEKIEIESKLTETFVYAPLQKEVSTDKKKALEQVEIFGPGTQGFGLYFENEEKRVYPNNELAAHVLGFIGRNEYGDLVGQYGVQGYYYGDITGRQGYSYEEKDSEGNVILTAEYEPILPRDGKDFKLTIIPNIQSKVEEQLEKGVRESRAKSGTAIVMDPKTGAIIAMANYPTYDPNEYWRTSEPWILRNRAVSDVYEYGSVQKPITISIALETGAIDENYYCNDTKGYLDLYEVTGYADLRGDRIHTWNRLPAGKLDISGILRTSNNPCTALIALDTDFNEFYSSLRDFGIGEFMGIGLQEEGTSYLKSKETWTRLDTITTSFGQGGISATALQLISALSTIANDGVRMRPYIISQISDEKETIKIQPQVISRPISKETADIVKKALAKAVQENSLSALGKPLLRYDIAAKTGTAQIAREGVGGYDEFLSNDTVVGFAPSQDPKMIMLVKLQEPKTERFASLTTVPIWRDIFLTIADDLEIMSVN
jgi:cell division protein FtsI (penicillin-binding protein 3)